jgi:hypothetical protein
MMQAFPFPAARNGAVSLSLLSPFLRASRFNSPTGASAFNKPTPKADSRSPDQDAKPLLRTIAKST